MFDKRIFVFRKRGLSSSNIRPADAGSFRVARLFVAAFIISAFFVGLTAPAKGAPPQIPIFGKKDKKDKKDAKETANEPKEETITFEMLKEYAVKKYQNDKEFKGQVDKEYAELMRAHQLQAFRVNTNPPLRVMGELETESGNGQARYSGASAASESELKDALYENPMLQDYINRIGQTLVPKDSTKLYAFRILQDPLPRAEALSTGTIYISTGFLGMLDNEAQLAYIMSHEIAHVEKGHWFNKSVMPLAAAKYQEEKEAEAAARVAAEAAEIAAENARRERRRRIFGMIGLGAGAAVGGLTGSGALYGGVIGGYGSYSVASLLIRDLTNSSVPSKITITEWREDEEDEADIMAMEMCLANNYDIQEVPKLYNVVKNIVKADPRAGLGFIGSLRRVDERITLVEKQLTEKKEKIQELSSQRKLKGIGKGFEALMAEVKRDNGVIALYYDMFNVARTNLEWSLRKRRDDAKAHYYMGLVLKLTARNEEEKERAYREFSTALELDKKRCSLPGIRLQQAIALLDRRDPSKFGEIVQYLKEYVRLYKLNNYGRVPPNMDILYDYMTQAGDGAWFTPPVGNISTQDVDPVAVKDTAVLENGAQPVEKTPAKPSGRAKQ